MNELLKLSETHPDNRCNCKLHIRDKRIRDKKKNKKKFKSLIFQ